MSDMWYYDYKNLNSTLRKALLKTGLPNMEYIYLYNVVNTRISMFDYPNLYEKVPGLTPEILETALMFTNHLCFYYIDGLQRWELCQYIYGNEYSDYLKPKSVDLIALNGKPLAYRIPYDDIILVRDNRMDLIPFIMVYQYIQKIQHIEDDMFKMLDVNCLPLVIVGDKKMIGSLKQTAMALGNKNPYFIADPTIVNDVKSFNINTNTDYSSIYDLKLKYRNELVSSLGIYSVDQKRERMVTTEINSQNDYTDFCYQAAKLERERFIKELNEKSGLGIIFKETYDINMRENALLEADKTYLVSKAEAKGEVTGNPDINKPKEVLTHDPK